VWIGGQDYIYYDELGVTEDEWREFRKFCETLEGRIIEANYDPDHFPPYRWKFMRFRDDKEHANHISSVEKITASIKDCVKREELIANSSKIRVLWKKREKEN